MEGEGKPLTGATYEITVIPEFLVLPDGSRVEGVADFLEGHIVADEPGTLAWRTLCDLIDESGQRRAFRIVSRRGNRFELDLARLG